jgi:hypothetical protein
MCAGSGERGDEVTDTEWGETMRGGYSFGYDWKYGNGGSNAYLPHKTANGRHGLLESALSLE